MPSFQQQVLNAFESGVSRTEKLLKAHKSLLALAKAEGDAHREKMLKLVIRGFERDLKMYKDSGKQARTKK